jgi:spermidine synthase
MSLLKSLLSYAWPVPVWEGRGKYGPLKLVWEEGHLVVNSGNANQSYGSLHAVWQQCLDDEQVAKRNPADVLVLGFGAGSLAHILRKELRLKAPITGVDGDPEMLRIARTHFHVDRLADLELVESDALAFVQGNERRYSLVLVDLCHELDLAPGVDGVPFIAGLRKCTAEGGLLCFNTIAHNAPSTARSQRVGELLRPLFTQVKLHHYQGVNRVWTAA